MRTLLAVGALLALLLAACSTNTGSTTSPTPTEAMMASPDAMATPADSGMAMTCSEAFTSISASDLASISSLSSGQALLDGTIQSCSTVDDWKSAAQNVLPALDLSTAEDFLKQRCQANAQLSATQLCTAVGA
jgi:hypothetical protein